MSLSPITVYGNNGSLDPIAQMAFDHGVFGARVCKAPKEMVVTILLLMVQKSGDHHLGCMKPCK